MKTKSDIWIKVLSLGVGLAVGIVLIAKVFFELSYDSFYKDIDRVYTINTWYSHQGEEKDYGQVSGAVFSLLIALLGLLGFIRDESLRRSKEMAVRKINGATTRDILSVFASDILKLSGVMAVIACIGAFFVARKWLEQFAEKVSLSPLYFICGALLVLAIVQGVVVLNCLKIARANPVVSLKNE